MFMKRKSNNLFNQSSSSEKKLVHNPRKLIIYYKYNQYFYNFIQTEKNYKNIRW